MRIMREDNARSGQQGGVIMQITSMGGFMGFPGNAWYHASKFAVEGFTESVNREVRPEWNSKLIHAHWSVCDEQNGVARRFTTTRWLTGRSSSLYHRRAWRH